MEVKTEEKLELLVSNEYNFTLKQTSGDEAKEEESKRCHFEQQATVTFRLGFSSEKKGLQVSVSQEKLALGEYFHRNGYKRELIDSLEKTLLATYQQDQLFAPFLLKALKHWFKQHALHKILFGQLASDNSDLTFFAKGSQLVVSY